MECFIPKSSSIAGYFFFVSLVPNKVSNMKMVFNSCQRHPVLFNS